MFCSLWMKNLEKKGKTNRNNSIYCRCSNKRPNSTISSNISFQWTNSNYVLSSVETWVTGKASQVPSPQAAFSLEDII